MTKITKKHNGFRRGHGASVFACSICKRGTRYTGVQGIGTELCPQCYEIAGLDNTINDNGFDAPESQKYIAEANGYLAEIAKLGGDVERVKKFNTYVFPTTAAKD